MQRINLSVKILLSQVNTAVLLHEELDTTIVGKILPSLKREQRKKQKGKMVGSFFCTLLQWPATRYTSTGDGLWHQPFSTRRVCGGEEDVQAAVSSNMVCLLRICISWSFWAAPLQAANSSGLCQTGKHRCVSPICIHVTCNRKNIRGQFNTSLVKQQS